MLLTGQSIYTGGSSFKSEKNQKTYLKANFLDTTGEIFSADTDSIVDLPQLTKCNFVVNCTTGKYPRTTLISCVAVAPVK